MKYISKESTCLSVKSSHVICYLMLRRDIMSRSSDNSCLCSTYTVQVIRHNAECAVLQHSTSGLSHSAGFKSPSAGKNTRGRFPSFSDFDRATSLHENESPASKHHPGLMSLHLHGCRAQTWHRGGDTGRWEGDSQ